jgi:hypothetical protein
MRMLILREKRGIVLYPRNCRCSRETAGRDIEGPSRNLLPSHRWKSAFHSNEQRKAKALREPSSEAIPSWLAPSLRVQVQADLRDANAAEAIPPL